VLFSAISHLGCSLRDWILSQFNISVFRVHRETQSSWVVSVHDTYGVASTLCTMPNPSWTESGLCLKPVLGQFLMKTTHTCTCAHTHTHTHTHTHIQTHNVKAAQNVYVFCTQNTLSYWKWNISATQSKYAPLHPNFFTLSTAYLPWCCISHILSCVNMH
jgi:hypothetical protein